MCRWKIGTQRKSQAFWNLFWNIMRWSQCTRILNHISELASALYNMAVTAMSEERWELGLQREYDDIPGCLSQSWLYPTGLKQLEPSSTICSQSCSFCVMWGRRWFAWQRAIRKTLACVNTEHFSVLSLWNVLYSQHRHPPATPTSDRPDIWSSFVYTVT